MRRLLIHLLAFATGVAVALIGVWAVAEIVARRELGI